MLRSKMKNISVWFDKASSLSFRMTIGKILQIPIQAETFAKPYFVLFVILTLNEVKGKNLYQTKNKILHFSAKSSE